jgi:tRNA (guanine-N7-)-methyltransferase
VNWRLHFPKYFGGTDEENEKIYVNSNLFCLDLTQTATEYPLDYPTKVDDTMNGRIGNQVEFVDVGCGFGGLLSRFHHRNLSYIVALAEKFPDKLSFGMEIRDKLCNFIGEKIRALRLEHPGKVIF